jgi:hypothetical protein
VTLKLDYEPEGTMENIGSAIGVVSGRVAADLQHFKDFIQRRPMATGAWRGEIRGDKEDHGSSATM